MMILTLVGQTVPQTPHKIYLYHQYILCTLYSVIMELLFVHYYETC